MSIVKKFLHKIHTVSINRTRKHLQRFDEFLVQQHPGFDLGFQDGSKPTFHPSTLRTKILARDQCVAVPVHRLRGWQFFPVHTAAHPYYFALTQSMAAGGITPTRIATHLRAYYARIHNLRAAEWMGVPQNTFWRDYDAYVAVTPWSRLTPQERKNSQARVMAYDSRVNGYSLTIAHGVPYLGPVSDELLHLETQRLYTLARSIQQDGYQTQALGKNAGGTVLLHDNGTWCVSVEPGQHRAVVAAALGYASVPLELQRIIRRVDAPHWTQVQRGTYTLAQARQIFDRILAGKLPHAFKAWTDYILSRQHINPDQSS